MNLYGPDLNLLSEAGERLMKVLREVDGAADVSGDQVVGLPSLRVIVDRKEEATRNSPEQIGQLPFRSTCAVVTWLGSWRTPKSG